MTHILIIFSFLLIFSILVSCYKKEETLYRWETSNGWEWKNSGDKNKNTQYIGEVKKKYIVFGDYILEGLGSLTVPNGEKYVGEFKDGKRHGQGTVTIPNGTKYEGEWKDDEFNGQGTYTFYNGGSFVGLWKDSVPWNITGYNEKREFVKYVKGKKIK